LALVCDRSCCPPFVVLEIATDPVSSCTRIRRPVDSLNPSANTAVNRRRISASAAPYSRSHWHTRNSRPRAPAARRRAPAS